MNQPFEIAIVTGFGEKGIEHFSTNPSQTVSHIIPSAPWHKALLEPEEVIANVTKKLDDIPNENLVLIGHSYGALIALVVACRRQLKGILKLGLIDGPLRSDVEVKPAKMAHQIFYKHYRDREHLAKECEEAIKQFPAEIVQKILTIGVSQDRIVPPEAKKLRNLTDVRLGAEAIDPNHPLGTSKKEKAIRGGTNVIIDIPEMTGHRLTKPKAELYGRIIGNML